MKTQTLEIIPPQRAEFYLSLSRGNGVRKNPLIRRHVDMFVRLLKSGEFQHGLPNGIAFHQDGSLVNGHHRLHGICISGITAEMWVTRGLSDADVLALDQEKIRTTADLTGLDRKVTDALLFASRILTNQTGREVSAKSVLSWSTNPFGLKIKELVSYCNTRTKVFSAAPVKCAAAYWAITGHQDYAFSQYRALNTYNFEYFTKISALFARRVATNELSGGRPDELFSASMRVFNPSKKDYKKLFKGSDESKTEFKKITNLVFGE
jgi:hypothetical protein